MQANYPAVMPLADYFAWCAGNIDASNNLLKSSLWRFRYSALLNHHQQDTKSCKAHLPGSCFNLGDLYDLQLDDMMICRGFDDS